MKLNLFLLLLGIALIAQGCATPAETTAAVAAGVASVSAIVKAVAPLLSPEMQAKLYATANSVDGTVAATRDALVVLVDAVTTIKAGVGAELAKHATTAQEAFNKLAGLPSREELWYTTTGVGAASTGASRALAAVKVAKAAKTAGRAT